MTRDLATEGAVPGQQRMHCEPCPFAACLICAYKGGAYGPADEQPVKKQRRKEARDGRAASHR